MDKNTKDMLDALSFIKKKVEELPSKDEVRDIVREESEPQFAALKMKMDGINRRLDDEAMQRTDLKLPRRLHELEEKVYGPGSSRHPKHIPLN